MEDHEHHKHEEHKPAVHPAVHKHRLSDPSLKGETTLLVPDNLTMVLKPAHGVSSDAHRRYMSKFFAGDLVRGKGKAITIGIKEPVGTAMAKMNELQVLSLPVVTDKGAVGIVGLWEIVTAICFQPVFEGYDNSVSDKTTLNEEMLSEALKLDLFDAPVESLLSLSPENSLFSLDANESLEKILEYFSKGLHRVLVRGLRRRPSLVATEEKIDPFDYRFLSQADVVRFLHAAKADELHSVMEKDIGSLGLGKFRGELFKLKASSSALTGFRAFTTHQLSAAPIVDEKGLLLGTLSLSDVRGMTQDTFKLVLLPVLDFLTEFKKHSKQITAKLSDTLYHVMGLLCDNNIHRVWIVDDQEAVIGVVALTDVIEIFSPFHKAH